MVDLFLQGWGIVAWRGRGDHHCKGQFDGHNIDLCGKPLDGIASVCGNFVILTCRPDDWTRFYHKCLVFWSTSRIVFPFIHRSAKSNRELCRRRRIWGSRQMDRERVTICDGRDFQTPQEPPRCQINKREPHTRDEIQEMHRQWTCKLGKRNFF